MAIPADLQAHRAFTVPAHEPLSWDAIVIEHSARVYRLAYRLTGNKHAVSYTHLTLPTKRIV